MRVLVTGGAGFIGSNFVRHLLKSDPTIEVTNFDKLTYAGNAENLADFANDPRYRFVRGDIADFTAVKDLLEAGFDSLVHFAAETHVDRSIEDAVPFLNTNVLGTHCLLEAARRVRLPRFIHISTDEVYGSAPSGVSFTEDARLNPRNPYAASKAAAEHLVASYGSTYGSSVVILRSSNNFGPFQFPEKLIPLTIANARERKAVPIYGDGLQERDWLFVEDYCAAIALAMARAKSGAVYNVSAGSPQPNLHIVRLILQLLGKAESLVKFVEDRPGHDRRYALDSARIRGELGWSPRVGFEEGIRRTIQWYEANPGWLDDARSGEYRRYSERRQVRRPSQFGR
jgi:dTDP-glucose 4,6-dehydratase